MPGIQIRMPGTYILTVGMENYQAFKQGLMDEINGWHIAGMERVTDLFPLVGSFVNLAYPVPAGTVKFLQDEEVYLGAQVKDPRDESGKTRFGVIAREDLILICTYGENGTDPKIVAYVSR